MYLAAKSQQGPNNKYDDLFSEYTMFLYNFQPFTHIERVEFDFGPFDLIDVFFFQYIPSETARAPIPNHLKEKLEFWRFLESGER